MKILILTTTFPRWKDDTIPAFIYHLAKKLVKQGLEVVVLAPHYKGAQKFEIMDGIKIFRFSYFFPIKFQKLAYDGGILSNVKRSWLARFQIPFLFLAELFYAIRLIKKEKIDVINSHWIVPNGLVGAICKFLFGTPHVLTEHAAGLVALKKLPMKRFICNFIIKNTDIFTVVSRYIHKELLRLLRLYSSKSIESNKFKIIPMGVEVSKFRSNADKGRLKMKYKIYSKNVLLFIGRLVDKKGVEYLLKAFPNILQTNPDTLLIVCGDGPLREKYKNLVKKMKLENFVRFTGKISEEEKVDYLTMADILIVPSIETKEGDTEGLPVVILEGGASEKPIVASNAGGVGDAIHNGLNGFLVRQKDSKMLAEKINTLLHNVALRKKFGKRFRRLVEEKYSWQIVSSKFIEILRLVRVNGK